MNPLISASSDPPVVDVVQFSTGLASAEVAFRAVEAGHEVVLLTADTTIEDEDNWRFAREVHQSLGEPEWQILRDGRHPMQVGRDESCIPNNRMAVCSKILKREILRRYIDGRWGDTPEAVAVLLGYDWTEPHRVEASRPFWSPYQVASPLLERPYFQKGDLATWRAVRGIEPPRLYLTGAPHANCGGGCVRGGQVEWRRLLFWNRDRYLWWEAEEERSRVVLGKDVAIMRHRGGPLKDKALPLRAFREGLEADATLFDSDDQGGCGCDPFVQTINTAVIL